MPHTSASGALIWRPGRFRLSGSGKSRSVTSHFRQYTFSSDCIRNQRQPQLSQPFICTRNSMTNSPVLHLPPALVLAPFRSWYQKRSAATQASLVPMVDCRRRFHVVCHAHSAQIVEFSRMSARTLRAGDLVWGEASRLCILFPGRGSTHSAIGASLVP